MRWRGRGQRRRTGTRESFSEGCWGKLGVKSAKNAPTFRASARGKLGDAAPPAHSGVSASVGFPAVDGAGLGGEVDAELYYFLAA